MSFIEIAQEIKSLSRFEKLQLIEEISKMLREEESPGKHFKKGMAYPVFTPFNEEKAASQLQQFLKMHKS